MKLKNKKTGTTISIKKGYAPKPGRPIAKIKSGSRKA